MCEVRELCSGMNTDNVCRQMQNWIHISMQEKTDWSGPSSCYSCTTQRSPHKDVEHIQMIIIMHLSTHTPRHTHTHTHTGIQRIVPFLQSFLSTIGVGVAFQKWRRLDGCWERLFPADADRTLWDVSAPPLHPWVKVESGRHQTRLTAAQWRHGVIHEFEWGINTVWAVGSIICESVPSTTSLGSHWWKWL